MTHLTVKLFYINGNWHLQQSSLCVCLVCQCQSQSAVATANDDDDDDDKVAANDDVTVWLILEISQMLVLAVTNAQVCCPDFMAYCISA